MKKDNQRRCKVCSSESNLYDVVDFGKFCTQDDYYQYGLTGIPVYYVKCNNCKLIFTDLIDKKTHNEISELIYNKEYIKFDPDYIEARLISNAQFINRFMGSKKKLIRGLDYGGGNGLTASLLSTQGWSYKSCDPISNPIAPSTDFGNFNLISAFEVFEHIPDPIHGMSHLASYAADDCLLIVGTQVTDGQVKNSRLDWWYAGPRNGHVTLHSKSSLELLFNKHSFKYIQIDPSLHLGIRGTPPLPKQVANKTYNLFFSAARKALIKFIG